MTAIMAILIRTTLVSPANLSILPLIFPNSSHSTLQNSIVNIVRRLNTKSSQKYSLFPAIRALLP